MTSLPPNTVRVPLDQKCDVCNNHFAGYYNLTWYIHFCSVACFNSFLAGYYNEIDSIALEITDAADLFDKGDDPDEV